MLMNYNGFVSALCIGPILSQKQAKWKKKIIVSFMQQQRARFLCGFQL